MDIAMTPCSPCPEPTSRRGGFTLIEVTLVMLIMTMLAAALAIPLSAQLQLRRTEQTRRQLEEARDALLGFAAVHGRLPCPATLASRGLESFAAGGSAADGACETFHSGYLPAASLGLFPVDAEGFARDAWGGPGNRIRYAVFGGTTLNGVANPLTRANGMQSATLAGLGAASNYLYICRDGAYASGGHCGAAANQLTRRAAFVLLSTGANGASAPPAGSDEERNLDGDAVFVSRAASSVAGREFDDLLQWGAIHLVVNRMVLAGRLP
jgi:prepilin-type N-terminal cleavage/methylation domain-containing protein